MSVHLSLCSDTHRFPALHSVSPFLPIFDFHQTALLQLSQNTHTSTCSLCIWSTVLYAHRETEIDRLDRKGKNKSVYGRSEILNRLKNKTKLKSLCQWRRKKTKKKKLLNGWWSCCLNWQSSECTSEISSVREKRRKASWPDATACQTPYGQRLELQNLKRTSQMCFTIHKTNALICVM